MAGLAGSLILPAPALAVAAAKVFVSGDTVYFDGRIQNLPNKLAVSDSGSAIVFDDVQAIAPGTGCTRPVSSDPTRASCTGAIKAVVVRAGGGDDNVTVNIGLATIGVRVQGDEGNDVILGDEGGNYADVLHGDAGDDYIHGRGGYDFIDGGAGADTMYGGAGADRVYYSQRTASVTASIDGVVGNDGEAGEGDTIGTDVEGIYGGSGSDVLIGGLGDDSLYGDGGADILIGNGGNDRLEADFGEPYADTIFGGAGTDTVIYINTNVGVWVDLDNNFGDDGAPGEGDSVIDVENIDGTPYGDTLIGNSAANVINASGGDDLVIGLDGDDTITGSTGDDNLFGGNGADHLDGGPQLDYCNVGEGGHTAINCES